MAQKICGETPPEVKALLEKIHSRYGNRILAVLFYGSCLRTNVFVDNVADFYVIVSDLSFNKNPFIGLLNRLLPPNVYYMETKLNDNILRAKYGIFTINQFKNMSSMNAFHPYLWARLVQPMMLVYVKDDEIKQEIIRSMFTAILTLITNVAPLAKSSFNLKEFWLKALSLTYSTEIRPEGKKNIVNIYNANVEFLDYLAKDMLNLLPYPIEKVNSKTNKYLVSISTHVKIISVLKWFMRIIYGKSISAIRLLKSLFTFENALEYGYYKLSKHTPDVVIPHMFKDNLFFSCFYLFVVGIKRKIF